MALNSGSSALSLAIRAVIVSLALPGEDFAHALDAEFLDRRAGLACGPGVVAGEFGEQRGPVGFGECSFVAEQRLDDVGLELRERAGPGRIHSRRAAAGTVGCDARQRESRRSRPS